MNSQAQQASEPSRTSSPFMRSALSYASQALYRSNPNPRVGCVIVSSTGDVLGVGSTQAAGSAHAEVMALRDVAARGLEARGATAYVTLEPCSHRGRTGPCCDALISAGIQRVVASVSDPNPLVAGQGFAKLRAAGVAVEVGEGAEESVELNVGFFSRMIRGTPWVRLKTAISLDGATALQNGQSQWITSPQARADGHAWRARACAVLTGIGTVLADDPSLDVREVETPRQPHLVIVDSDLRTPANARLWSVSHRSVLIYTGIDAPSRKSHLEALGAQVITMPDASGRVELAAMLRDLAQRNVNELHVEAGQTLNGALVEAHLVDEVLAYVAPKLLGAGTRGITSWGPLQSLQESATLEFHSHQPVGPDLRLLARPPGRAAFVPRAS
ncbi:bifunctional diaminohydroxyphosphoribosylaminopyrimidine deaminase/5-amino-6-(5-phosphoribosylamino)uracil reductase RibD [Paracidovorax wautersii]|uniref:Riboflavin biosynthesis protein RibD n=1 Tax=Paracidovorax wautersii TaxID=1177982 RepID=A0A1I2CND5_9BURK|nr:diaminohydroxyphosphoribosylaminopyrimidine deaminase / 5-amino-6-(5-phosphoribosylamino)uracil reductase [Paracidovorax wautersii]